jgi:hypothetical protein
MPLAAFENCLDKILWAVTCLYIACLFLLAACALMRAEREEGRQEGKREVAPLRARNGQFIGRGE